MLVTATSEGTNWLWCTLGKHDDPEQATALSGLRLSHLKHMWAEINSTANGSGITRESTPALTFPQQRTEAYKQSHTWWLHLNTLKKGPDLSTFALLPKQILSLKLNCAFYIHEHHGGNRSSPGWRSLETVAEEWPQSSCFCSQYDRVQLRHKPCRNEEQPVHEVLGCLWPIPTGMADWSEGAPEESSLLNFSNIETGI